MKKNEISSDELRLALEEARPAFLAKKITIDDVSRDITVLEDQLNNNEATDVFSFSLGEAFCWDISQEVERHKFYGPVVSRSLIWKKHGSRWRLFYRSEVVRFGYAYPDSNFGELTSKELSTLKEACENISEDCVGLALAYKPLVDASSEIRLQAHPELPNFVRAFAENWQHHRYLKTSE